MTYMTSPEIEPLVERTAAASACGQLSGAIMSRKLKIPFRTTVSVLLLLLSLNVVVMMYLLISCRPTKKEEHKINTEKIRVLCWIPSMKERLDRVRAVNETWLARCDGHVFFINNVKPNFSDDVVVSPIMGEGRKMLSRKVKDAMEYVYDYHGSDYDWFLKADDDSYIVMENLKFLLSHYDPSQAVYLGHPLKWLSPGGYMQGGAGYVLSRTALQTFVVNGTKGKACQFELFFDGEDHYVGACLHKLGVPKHNTLDRHGRETFHSLNPVTHISGPIPSTQLVQDHFTMVAGDECCSELTISFHWVDAGLMRTIEHLLYKTSVYGRQVNVEKFKDFIQPGTLAPPYTYIPALEIVVPPKRWK
ncbi:hypothetical protein BaRGS_00008861 [Batillaria attramentaria]|uniref:N-acetylgalactosaminide beta-1,3-galactosyltransferase n=1 Tax=Batillaria attramentaria TaxID=370345 RepID=A0ABD0LLZ5_9CAEN